MGSRSFLKPVTVVPRRKRYVAAPTNLVATVNGTSQIDLTWQDNALDNTGYYLYRSLDGLVFSLAATLGDVQAYNDTGLNSGTTYYYRLFAFGGEHISGESNIASATTEVVETLVSYTQLFESMTTSQAFDKSTLDNVLRAQEGIAWAGDCNAGVSIIDSDSRSGVNCLRLYNANVDHSDFDCADPEPTKSRVEVQLGANNYNFTNSSAYGDKLGWTFGDTRCIGWSEKWRTADNTAWANTKTQITFQIHGAGDDNSPVFYLQIGNSGRLSLLTSFAAAPGVLTSAHDYLFNAGRVKNQSFGNITAAQWADAKANGCGSLYNEWHLQFNTIATLALDTWYDFKLIWHKAYDATGYFALYYAPASSGAYTLLVEVPSFPTCPEWMPYSYHSQGIYSGDTVLGMGSRGKLLDSVRMGIGADSLDAVDPKQDDRNLLYEGTFETGLIASQTSLVNGGFIWAMKNTGYANGTSKFPNGGAGNYGTTIDSDCRLTTSEVVGGVTVTPRRGNYMLRGAIYFDKPSHPEYKDYNALNNGTVGNQGVPAPNGTYPGWLDKPRWSFEFSNAVYSLEYDEDLWFGFSIFIPANFSHDDPDYPNQAAIQLAECVGEGASYSLFMLEIRARTANTASNWVLVTYTDDSSTREDEGALEEILELEACDDDLGKWTDFVIRLRVNPFAVATNPSSLSIADSKNQLFAGNKGALQVWKSSGVSRAMTRVLNRVNQPVGLVPRATAKIKWSVRAYKYGWKRNDTDSVSPIIVFFDEIRFGSRQTHGTDYPDVHLGYAAEPVYPVLYEQTWASFPNGAITKTTLNATGTMDIPAGGGGCETIAGGRPRNNWTITNAIQRRAGEKTLKVQVNTSDPNQIFCGGSIDNVARAEIWHGVDNPDVYEYGSDKERWFGFSFYIASSDTETIDYINQSIGNDNHVYMFQIFGSRSDLTYPPGMSASPVVEMRLDRQGKLTLRHNIASGSENYITFADRDGLYELNAWNDVVIHYRSSSDNSGFLRVWVNAASEDETPAWDYQNTPVCWTGFDRFRFKYGLYVPNTTTMLPADKEIKVAFSAIRIDDASGSFASVHPGQGD